MSNNYYTKYLQSPHWQKIRKKIYRRKKNKYCVLCRSRSKLNIHHARYKEHGESVLYKEEKYHLFVLCESCHKAWHELKPPLILKQKYISRVKELKHKYKLTAIEAITNCGKRNYSNYKKQNLGS